MILQISLNGLANWIPSAFALDDLHEAKSVINELNRRLHEMELELRRLENERDELTAAYKEAEAVSSIRPYPLSTYHWSSRFPHTL